ncbi:hypothetical protein [Pseudomonas sp. St316]|uniref:hypothetical protein n=1 Tax=Pseudomonas sp. St316 TaxID=2678257 RepID=UPI001BB359E0|nr:hypothetical protein [Pseudomonas sp. St316]BBP60419.1 hypothetical protein PHLH4_40090 [Pseudomonas sp. St316]
MIAIKERPILFSAPMVRAILEGRKTVTRRAVKGVGLKWLEEFTPGYVADPANSLCPYGLPGDRLWVRETWVADAQLDAVAPRELSQGEPILYPADGAVRQSGCSMISPGKGRPSIHMPRWVSRILLDITEVRVERLQEISEEQAKAEGVRLMRDGSGTWVSREGPGRLVTPWTTAKEAFGDLWNSINGTDAWDANPWVWVVEFKRATP